MRKKLFGVTPLLLGLGLFVVSCGGQDPVENGPFATIQFAASSAANFAMNLTATRTDGPPCGLTDSFALNCDLLDGSGQFETPEAVCTGTWDFTAMFLWTDDTTSCLPSNSFLADCDDMLDVDIQDGDNIVQITCHSAAQGNVIFDVQLDP